MDPELQALGAQLADTAVRNTAGAVADRIGAAKARKRDRDTIAELEEIVNGLLSDKAELVRIAQTYEEELVAQRISPSDIAYISTNLVPLLTRLVETAAASKGDDTSSVQEVLDLVQPLLAVETVTVLQLIGFNIRRAIGEPLTQFVSRLILSQAQPDPETQRLGLQREVAYLEVARDPEAHARLSSMIGA